MKLILHVGMHKTGTSALQALLRSRKVELVRQGMLYPDHGQHHDGAHHGLWHALADRDHAAAFVAEIFGEADAAGAAVDTILLSSELLEKLGADPARRTTLDTLLDPFESVVVVYFMRNQAEVIQSIFKQWVKDDAVRLADGPANFLRKHGRNLYYSKYASWWENTAKKVSVRAARYTGDWNELWADFSALTRANLQPIEQSALSNVSMDGQRLKLKHWLNGYVPRERLDIPINAWLAKNFSNDPKTSLFRHSEDFLTFQSAYRRENQELAQRWGVIDLDAGRVRGDYFQTASPVLVARFVRELERDPQTQESELLASVRPAVAM